MTSTSGSTDLAELLSTMEPSLDPATYVVVTSPPGTDAPPGPLATVVESEGTSSVIERRALPDALARGATPSDPPSMARITLTVHSSLLAVGLTAAVSSALAAEGISCNVIAGYHHDHLLVPVERAHDAIAVLEALSAAT